jgi:hypothetical protein
VSETTAQSTVPAPSTEQREESSKSAAYPSAAAQAAAALTAHLPQRDERDSGRPRQADILRQIGETGYRSVPRAAAGAPGPCASA